MDDPDRVEQLLPRDTLQQIALRAGADKVARFFVGLMRKYGYPEEHRPVFVNGELGMALPAYGEVSARVTSFTVHEGKVLAVYDIANPDKLRHVDFWSGP